MLSFLNQLFIRKSQKAATKEVFFKISDKHLHKAKILKADNNLLSFN